MGVGGVCKLHLSQTPDRVNYKIYPIIGRTKIASSNIISTVLPQGFGTPSTILLHFPWSTVAVTEHTGSSIYFMHSRYSKPWLPTYPVLMAPTFPACVWRAGRSQPHRCCISVLALWPAPIHFLRTGISRVHVQLSQVLGGRTRMLPWPGPFYGTSCPLLVDSLSMPSIEMLAP